MTSPNLNTFQWPCDRRDAHHPHVIVTVADGECDMDCDMDWDMDSDLAWHADACGTDVKGETHTDCPGVQAHPATQIGGNHLSERPEAPRF